MGIYLCAGRDSNPRRRLSQDLQSRAFDHSATDAFSILFKKQYFLKKNGTSITQSLVFARPALLLGCEAGYTVIMTSQVRMIRDLFVAYAGLVLLFNFVVLFFIKLPGLQLFFSSLWVLGLIAVALHVDTGRKVVWWGALVLSILGVVRPILEFLFSFWVPDAAHHLFPYLTPAFGIVGFIMMSWCLILILRHDVQKEFTKS